MRILHIIATLDPQAGGPSHSVARIVSAYPGAGVQGEVLSLDAPGAPFLRTIAFTVHAIGPVYTRFGFSTRLIPWLVANRERFDGVVVHGLWQFIGYAVRRTIEGRKPYLVFAHGMLDPYFKRAHPLKHLKKISYWLLNEFWVLRGAHRVLFTSPLEAARAVQSFWPHRWKACVVPYGIRFPDGNPAALKRTFLESYPRLAATNGSARRFLLFLGRIHSKKGCDLLLAAFATIANRAPDLDLVFAGPDGERGSGTQMPGMSKPSTGGLKANLVNEARRLGISNRVHWTGMLEGDQKWGAFHACEAFCLPSHQENFGIAVAEALACGKAVLISDKVDICQEILADGAALVGPDTLPGTLQTLETWLALSAEEKAAMGERALQCFSSRYDMHSSASGIVEVFAQAIAITGKHPIAAEAKVAAH